MVCYKILSSYKKWPEFLNVESYKILAAWNKGVRTDEQCLRDEGMEEMEFVEAESNFSDLVFDYIPCTHGCEEQEYYDENDENLLPRLLFIKQYIILDNK